MLENALLKLARNQVVKETVYSAYGLKYVIVGSIETPCRKIVNILTVWIVDAGGESPRFVTARPYKLDI